MKRRGTREHRQIFIWKIENSTWLVLCSANIWLYARRAAIIPQGLACANPHQDSHLTSNPPGRGRRKPRECLTRLATSFRSGSTVPDLGVHLRHTSLLPRWRFTDKPAICEGG